MEEGSCEPGGQLIQLPRAPTALSPGDRANGKLPHSNRPRSLTSRLATHLTALQTLTPPNFRLTHHFHEHAHVGLDRRGLQDLEGRKGRSGLTKPKSGGCVAEKVF
jgi:hypothetical protein